MNKFIIFVVLFFAVFCEEDSDEYKEYYYQGEESNTCAKIGETEDDTTRNDLTLKNCSTVVLPDENYKCCLETATVLGQTKTYCVPLKTSKVDDFINLQKESVKETGFTMDITIDCGTKDDDSSASNYLSKGLIILLSLLF